MNEIRLWTALITPMNPDGSVHYEDLKRLLKRQEDAGNGVLVLGSTGEGITFSEEEKREIIKFTASQNLKIPIMAGVGGIRLETQLEWIDYCNELDIDSYLLVTPLYSKPGRYGQTEWFSALLDRSDKRCMIYNIPSRTGVKLVPEVLLDLKCHANLWAVKEASGSINDFKNFRNTVPELPLFSGDDALLPEFTEFGCVGLVSVAANVWPIETKLYVEKCLTGDVDNLKPTWSEAVKALFSAPNPIPSKILLHSKKEITNGTLRTPLSEKDLSDSSHLLDVDRAVQEWYLKNK
tara:strand:+ start:50806 stop:51684 length:879 start_codon:yes stop_codon:yes gene_type:complete